MNIRNFYSCPHSLENAHDGIGQVKNVHLFRKEDFESPLKFVIYTEINPGDSIGYHTHGNDEEIYVVLEGQGKMTINNEDFDVKQGDVILNKKESSHGLINNSGSILKILVFEADI